MDILQSYKNKAQMADAEALRNMLFDSILIIPDPHLKKYYNHQKLCVIGCISGIVEDKLFLLSETCVQVRFDNMSIEIQSNEAGVVKYYSNMGKLYCAPPTDFICEIRKEVKAT